MEAEVEDILAELDGHRMQFIVLCRSLNDEQLARPVPKSTWIVRDFIAHLGTIDGPVAQMFRSLHEGVDPGVRSGDGQRWDVDRWNESRIQERRTKSVDELLFEAAAERTALRAVLASLTKDDLRKTITSSGRCAPPAGRYRTGRVPPAGGANTTSCTQWT